MSKEETVEVTIRVPKRLIEMLEQEKYFGWSKENFWAAAARTRISCEINDMGIKECEAVESKYGPIGQFSVDLVDVKKT